MSSPGVKESDLNDGSLDTYYNFVKIHLTGATFASDMNTGVIVNNLPAGLGIKVKRLDDNNIEVELTGNAENHSAADSVNNASVTIAKDKIFGSNANVTSGTFVITFNDEIVSPSEYTLRLSSMELVSVDSNGNQTTNYGHSYEQTISANGRYVAFSSYAANLVTGDTNENYDVFVRDLTEGKTVRVSVATDGAQGNSKSGLPSISANGRYVAFTSGSDLLVSGVTDYGIFIRDRVANTTAFLGQGGSPNLSANGRFVTFEASDNVGLVEGDTNGYSDIFVMDRDNEGDGEFDEAGDVQIERISLSTSGEQPYTYSNGPTISADGRFVSYYSQADNLVPDDTNAENDIFLFDRKNKLTKRISTSLTLKNGDEGSFEQSVPVSLDGKVLVAFTSDASTLVANDMNNETDIFLATVEYDVYPDNEKPVVPEPPIADELGPTWVKLIWSPATDNYFVTKYAVYRGFDPSGLFSQIALIDGDLTGYWDTTLTPDTDYYYYILAQDGEGNWSAPLPAYRVQTRAEVSAAPVPVQMAAGSYHSVVIRNGNVWSWGENRYGELGDGTDTESLVPVPVRGQYGIGALDNVAAVSAGQFYTAAVKEDGTVWTWGNNGEGQLGDGTSNGRYTPVPVKSPDGNGYLTDVVAIAAGPYFSMALRSDGTVWAWGANASGQLGIGIEDDWDDHLLPVQVKNTDGTGYLTGIKAIAAGGAEYKDTGVSMAIDENGGLWGWGYNYYGQLGDGSTGTERYLPIQVKDATGEGYLTDIMDVAVGGNHTIALSDDGTVKTAWTWGWNYYGQLGLGTIDNLSPYPPHPLPSVINDFNGSGGTLTGITDIAAGYEHSLALLEDGSMVAWGANYSSQLGYFTTETKDPSSLPGTVGEGGNYEYR